MVLLKIFKLEDPDEKEAVSILPCGEHVIGRGPLLQCNDKRVSRNHALIIVTNDKVTITSTHVNPCYFMSSEGKNMIILPKYEAIDLNTNDKFALLTHAFWYKVKLITESGDSEEKPSSSVQTNVHKRSADLDESENSKRLKLTNEDVNDLLNDADEALNGVDEVPEQSSLFENGEAKDDNTKSEEKEGVTNVPENASPSNDKANNEENEEVKNNEDVEVNPDADNDKNNEESLNNDVNGSVDNQSNNDNQPSTSQLRRERCWYGNNCFRKNPTHKSDFSHPGDDDYDSDPNDDRPLCPYGNTCYRKNKDHRRKYKHNGTPAQPRNNGGKPKKKRKANKKTATTADYDDSEDDYDYDDPFLDDSGDDFQPSSDGDDSDWDDSQEIQEDSQERKRRVKEAKRFTKK